MHLVFTTSLRRKSYYSHLTDEKVKAQSSYITFLRSARWNRSFHHQLYCYVQEDRTEALSPGYQGSFKKYEAQSSLKLK
jgi:hypothetical protein